MDDVVSEVMGRAAQSPAWQAFVALNVREAIVREARAGLLEVAQHGLVGEAAAWRLLDAWRDHLVAVEFAAAAPDADVSQAWRELGGVALALSAIADQMLSDS